MWQADSIRAGAFVSLGLGALAAVLSIASRLLVRAAETLKSSKSFALRHAVISLARPGGQTRVILMAVGLGCFFVVGIRILQANLLAELTSGLGQGSPDFVLIDIQSDQVDGIREATRPFVRSPARIVPLMRGRVVGIEGQGADVRTLEDIRREGRLGREFGLTFRDHVESNETVIDGTFWASALPAPAPGGINTDVSVEREAAADGRLDLGDIMTFDIAGQRIRARVTSVRTVRWDDSQNGGFVFVLRPAPAVERLARNYVGFLQAGDDAARRGAIERALVDKYPNVSAIDVREVINAIKGVVDNVALGITVVGAVTLVGGGLILIGAVAMTRFQRLYDAAVYRTLGASTRLVATMVATEYSILGLLAGTLGASGGLGLSWLLARYLLDIEWQPVPTLVAAGIGLTALAVAVVGLIASLDVLLKKPLTTLRSE